MGRDPKKTSLSIPDNFLHSVLAMDQVLVLKLMSHAIKKTWM